MSNPRPCARPGCEIVITPKRSGHRFCSRKCAAKVFAASRPREFYAELCRKGWAGRRRKGHGVLRQSDRLLMAAGRYAEAARALYDRGYSAGWISGVKRRSQLPDRRRVAGKGAA